MVSGFAAGYYMGARAGRQRYDQINRQISKLRSSETFEEVSERAKAVVEEGVEKARSVVESKIGDDGQANGHNGHGYGPEDASGISVPPPGTTGTTGTTATGSTGTGTTGATGSTGTGPAGTGEPPSGLGGYSSSR